MKPKGISRFFVCVVTFVIGFFIDIIIYCGVEVPSYPKLQGNKMSSAESITFCKSLGLWDPSVSLGIPNCTFEVFLNGDLTVGMAGKVQAKRLGGTSLGRDGQIRKGYI